MKLGQSVVAIGDPFGLEGSLTTDNVRHTTPGQKVALGVLRDWKTVSVEVTLAARPSQN